MVHVKGQSFIDKYRARPKRYARMNLLTFARRVTVRGQQYSEPKKESVVRVLPIIKYVPEGDNEAYYRQQAILHIPFKATPESILSRSKYQSWSELCKNVVTAQMPSSNLPDYNSSDDGDEDLVPVDHGIHQTAGEALAGNSNTHLSKVTLGTRLTDLTCDWTAGLQDIPTAAEIDVFLAQYKIQDLSCDSSSTESVSWTEAQLSVMKHMRLQINSLRQQNQSVIKRIIVQGKAGSGKSTLLEAMVHEITAQLGPAAVCVGAFTGAAAQNVNGGTLCSIFYLSSNCQLSAQNLKSFQTTHANTQFTNGP